MDDNFIIPLKRSDLLETDETDRYCVGNLVSLSSLSSAVRDIKRNLKFEKPQSILKNFPIIFSVVEYIDKVEEDVRVMAWDYLTHSVNDYATSLVDMLEQSMDEVTKMQLLNTLKMLIYLMYQFVEIYERSSRSSVALSTGRGRKKKSVLPSTSIVPGNWTSHLEKGSRMILKVLQLNLNLLWSPQYIEEGFISLISNYVYKSFENPDMCKDRAMSETLSESLAVIIHKYSNTVGSSVRVVQMLQYYEHIAPVMAQVVNLLCGKFSNHTFLGQVLRELCNVESGELVRDSDATRSYGVFLTEIASLQAPAILPYLSLVKQLLECEAYPLRNAVISALGEVLVQIPSEDRHKAVRENCLDQLEEYLHDQHAFVRNRCLQVFVRIIEQQALPVKRYISLLELVIGRLMDKTALIRKSSIKLTILLLKTNPFAAKLSLNELKTNFEKEKKKFSGMTDQAAAAAKAASVDKMHEDKLQMWLTKEQSAKDGIEECLQFEETLDADQLTCEYEKMLGAINDPTSVKEKVTEHLKNSHFYDAAFLLQAGRNVFPEDGMLAGPVSDEDEVEMVLELKLLHILQALFIADALASEVVNRAAGDGAGAAEPLSPTQAQGTEEYNKQKLVLEYLESCIQFSNLQTQASATLCQHLRSKTNSDVLEAIEFFVTAHEFKLPNCINGIRAMLPLMQSKEQPIREAVVSAYERLYIPVSDELDDRTQVAVVVKNLLGLSEGASVGDMLHLEKLVCAMAEPLGSGFVQVLWEKFTMKIQGTTDDESLRALAFIGMCASNQQEVLTSNISSLVNEGLGSRSDTNLRLATETCFCLLKLKCARLSNEDDVFQRLMHVLRHHLSKSVELQWIPFMEAAVRCVYHLAEKPDILMEELVKFTVHTILTDELANSCILTRVCSLFGQIALCQLIYLEDSILPDLKKRRCELDQQTIEGKKRTSTGRVKRNELTEEEEMGMSGASAEDTESDLIRKVTELELVVGDGLLSEFSSILVLICSNNTRYPDRALQSAASLALAKFMLVSSVFCEHHLQLLFTIMEKSEFISIRGNLIICAGDLCLRWPNLLEPWTPKLYSRLRDTDSSVRQNTLKVLTHLILNDMIKVKGQISDVASCIVDEDLEIAALAKLLFLELSQKGNSLYNIMPDIISRLSDSEIGVKEEEFREILRYLLTFLQKERQCENLVEKLCLRFQAGNNIRHWRDLAFCLSQISFNEKCLRKLLENFACFADKLMDEQVYKLMTSILNSHRNSSKTETKELVDELESKMERSHQSGVDDEMTNKKAASAVKAKSKRGRRKTKNLSDSSSDEETKPRRVTRGCIKRVYVDSDSDDEEFEVGNKNSTTTAHSNTAKPSVSVASGNQQGCNNNSGQPTDDEPIPDENTENTGRTQNKLFPGTEIDDDEAPKLLMSPEMGRNILGSLENSPCSASISNADGKPRRRSRILRS